MHNVELKREFVCVLLDQDNVMNGRPCFISY